MSIATQAIGFIFVSLIVINGLLGGGVADAIGTFATDDEKEQARADILCGIGYLLWVPTSDFHGIEIPIPSYSNVLVAALASLSVILILRITTGIDWQFKYSILTFLIVWITIKAIGFTLLQMSSDTCMVWAEQTISKTSGFYDVAAIFGGVYGLKILWGIRK